MKLTSQQLIAYFQAVLPFCNKRKVAALLQKCNVDADVTPENCLVAYETHFTTFAPAFGRIAHTAINSNKYATYAKAIQGELQAGQYSPAKATGLRNSATKFVVSAASEKMSAEQKFQMGMGVISAITDSISLGRNWINKDSELTKAEAEKLRAAAENEKAQGETAKAWIWPVTIGTVLLIAIVVYAVLKRR